MRASLLCAGLKRRVPLAPFSLHAVRLRHAFERHDHHRSIFRIWPIFHVFWQLFRIAPPRQPFFVCAARRPHFLVFRGLFEKPYVLSPELSWRLQIWTLPLFVAFFEAVCDLLFGLPTEDRGCASASQIPVLAQARLRLEKLSSSIFMDVPLNFVSNFPSQRSATPAL